MNSGTKKPGLKCNDLFSNSICIVKINFTENILCSFFNKIVSTTPKSNYMKFTAGARMKQFRCRPLIGL